MKVIKAHSLEVEPFDESKIFKAVREDVARFGLSLSEYEMNQIVLNVVEKLRNIDMECIWSSTIRDMVVSEMLSRGVMCAEKCATIGISLAKVLDIFEQSDESATDNANLPKASHEAQHKHIADYITKQIFYRTGPKDAVRSHLRGDIHVHDLDYPTRIFCFDTDLRCIFYRGLLPDGTGTQYPTAAPAKHPTVAVLHAAKALGCSQSECAGGQGFAYFNIFIAPYLRGLSEDEIEQLAQMFIYEMGQMMVARGGQAVFSSIQIWPDVPAVWADRPVVWHGKIDENLHYGDFAKEAQAFGKALLRVYLQGDARGRPFSFPKPEIVITPHYWTDLKYKEFYDLALKCSLKYGTPYYEVITRLNSVECYQCCAYNFVDDKPSQNKLCFNKDHFNNLGSIQVMTINLPRVAYRMRNFHPQKLKDILDELLQNIFDVFEWKRNIIKNSTFPYLTQNINGASLANIDDLSFIIGIVGLNEYVEYLTGRPLHEDIDEIGLKTLSMLNLMIGRYANAHGMKVALARTPAETTSGRFAHLDQKYYPESTRVLKGNAVKYYTNGAMVPDQYAVPLDKKIEVESKYFKILQSNIFHIFTSWISPFVNIDDVITEENVARLRDLIDRSIGRGISYFAVTRDLTICNQCNHVAGALVDKCARCGSNDVEGFSRITGYVQAISGWNAAKLEELKDRRRYTIINLSSPIEQINI
ncbi:MAG: ribonucleotide reductase of class III (anaerobic), large subunit [Phage 5P_1]|nr:MAG: ribonucleotide reductase of class III (anaerobic), large subunit [Phage 5P_1]